MKNNKSSAEILFFCAAFAVLLWLAPAEQTLGHSIKIIYFHSVLTYAALYLFYAAGAAGLFHILTGRTVLGLWARELSVCGIAAWAVSFISSLVSMKIVWGGFFWLEPRTIFAVFVLILALGKQIITQGSGLKFNSAANLLFALTVLLTRINLARVMHPESPITTSDSLAVKLFPFLLLLLTLAAFINYCRRRLAAPVTRHKTSAIFKR